MGQSSRLLVYTSNLSRGGAFPFSNIAGVSKGMTPCAQEDEYWDWYFLMQHHGAATRLLDWTDGALIALHFASKAKGEKDKDNRVVYLLAPDRHRTS